MSARIPLAAVLGHPVAHSRSPRLHGYWLERFALAGHYIPLDVRPEDLREVVAALPRMGFVGFNVTIPHKETIIGLADRISDAARRIGAANTISFENDGSIFADNTDGIGFVENLRSNAPGWGPAEGPAAILGAGGACRAVIAALLDEGVPELRLANRTRKRAEALRQAFGSRVVLHDWDRAGEMLKGAVTVVNTTSLGMTGHAPLSVELDRLEEGAVVTDLVYTPLETEFLQAARGAGCRTVDGLGMLIHQAAPGFERWFGVRPEIDERTRQVVLGR